MDGTNEPCIAVEAKRPYAFTAAHGQMPWIMGGARGGDGAS